MTNMPEKIYANRIETQCSSNTVRGYWSTHSHAVDAACNRKPGKSLRVEYVRADLVQQWKERAYNAGHCDRKYGTPCEQIRKQQEAENDR